ncbi:hypothetical protein K3495_g3338 [Podosphaera aphanis]|nr:hypothetical protein K3495_g3338 [Podosphaera aphanis]
MQDQTTRLKFPPLQVRDKINQAFKAKRVEGPVVAIVSNTRKENIALTTTDQYSAEFFMEKVDIWKNLAPHVYAIKDEPWFKVVIDGVPTTEFGNIEELSSICEEIRVFNKGFHIIGQPYLLTPKETSNQVAGSVVVAFETEAEARQATSKKLIISGRSLMAEKYLSIPATTQCSRCQRFGHMEKSCRLAPLSNEGTGPCAVLEPRGGIGG